MTASQLRASVKWDETAGTYSDTIRKPKTVKFEPAANELPARDFESEAHDARSIVDNFVTYRTKDDLKFSTISALPNKKALSAVDRAVTVSKLQSEKKKYDFLAPSIKISPDPGQAYFISTQEWDGYVTSLSEDSFEASIFPVSADCETNSEEIVTVPFWLVDDETQKKVTVGAVFRLATGRSRIKRQIMHGTKIYFRKSVDFAKRPNITEERLAGFFDE